MSANTENVFAENYSLILKELAAVRTAAVLAEREACAMVCAKWANSLNDSVSITALNICDAIRARGKDEPVTQPISALTRYNEVRDEDPAIDMGNALERLRFFCSLSMPGQDWLDVEPFFDALEEEQALPVAWLYQTKSGFRKCWLADEQDDPKFLADRAATLEFPSAHSWTPLYAGPQQASPAPHPDTVRLAYLYSGKQTCSNLLVDAEMRLLTGESLTLEEARAAIDDAMKSPLEGALDQQALPVACPIGIDPTETKWCSAQICDACKAQQAQPVREPICRTDGRCQYAIDHGAEGLGHCPKGKCVMPDGEEQAETNEGNG